MNDNSTKSGVSILTVLVVVFLVLKLTGNIDWSWWWVFSPYWIPFVLFIAGAAAVFIIAVIVAAVKTLKPKKSRVVKPEVRKNLDNYRNRF